MKNLDITAKCISAIENFETAKLTAEHAKYIMKLSQESLNYLQVLTGNTSNHA